MNKDNQCDLCSYYVYDDETDMYVCDMNLDEDDMGRLYSTHKENCPYFHLNDEYKIVKKQM